MGWPGLIVTVFLQVVFCEVKIKLELKTSQVFYSPFPLISSSDSIFLAYFIQDGDIYGYLYICVYPCP